MSRKHFRKITPTGELDFIVQGWDGTIPAYDSQGTQFPAYVTYLQYRVFENNHFVPDLVQYTITAMEKGEDVHNYNVIKAIIEEFPQVNLEEYEEIA